MIALNTSVNQLVESNQPLVLYVYKKLRYSDAVRMLDKDDAIAAGNMGLLRAARTYKPEVACFSTYAHLLIKQAIFKEARKNYQFYVRRTGELTESWVESRDRESEYDADEIALAVDGLGSLSPRERFVMQARTGMNLPARSLEQIGDMLGVSKERVRQICDRAAEKMFMLLDAGTKPA